MVSSTSLRCASGVSEARTILSAAVMARSATWVRSSRIALLFSCSIWALAFTRSCSASARALLTNSALTWSASWVARAIISSRSRAASLSMSCRWLSRAWASAWAFSAPCTCSRTVFSRSSMIWSSGFQANFPRTKAKIRNKIRVKRVRVKSTSVRLAPPPSEDRTSRDRRRLMVLLDGEEDGQEQDGDHQVAGQHVREQTDHEREGLGEHADDLDRDHDGQEPPRQTRGDDHPEVVDHPVLRDAGPLLGQEGDGGQGQGHRDVAGRGGGERHEAEQGRHQDEEQEAAEERHEPRPVAMADVLLGDVVADEDDQPLHEGPDPRRDPPRPVAPQGQPGH